VARGTSKPPDHRRPRFRVVLGRAFSFDDVPAADAWMQAGRQLGKVVVRLD
jgi:NADPH:quinone reductase-like Zn-dependent oxidoreductase